MAKERPGVMLYFDIRPAIKRLSLKEKGLLLDAILTYGEFGTMPAFEDRIGLAVAWDFIQPKIDLDAERYAEQAAKGRYAVYARETKKAGETPLVFADWKIYVDNA